MPAFTLYGARGSSNTDRVRLVLAEGGFTDYELVALNMQQGEHKSEEHLSRNPWGKVPSVSFPDGFKLFESRAISKYLAKKYSFPLLPSATDLEATALFDQAECAEIMYFTEPAGKISFEKFVKKFMGLPADEAAVASSLKALDASLTIINGTLEQRKWMAGNEFSLVDIYYIPMVRRLFACGYEDDVLKHEAVAEWWKRVVARPAIAKLLAADQEAAAAAARK